MHTAGKLYVTQAQDLPFPKQKPFSSSFEHGHSCDTWHLQYNCLSKIGVQILNKPLNWERWGSEAKEGGVGSTEIRVIEPA